MTGIPALATNDSKHAAGKALAAGLRGGDQRAYRKTPLPFFNRANRRPALGNGHHSPHRPSVTGPASHVPTKHRPVSHPVAVNRYP